MCHFSLIPRPFPRSGFGNRIAQDTRRTAAGPLTFHFPTSTGSREKVQLLLLVRVWAALAFDCLSGLSYLKGARQTSCSSNHLISPFSLSSHPPTPLSSSFHLSPSLPAEKIIVCLKRAVSRAGNPPSLPGKSSIPPNLFLRAIAGTAHNSTYIKGNFQKSSRLGISFGFGEYTDCAALFFYYYDCLLAISEPKSLYQRTEIEELANSHTNGPHDYPPFAKSPTQHFIPRLHLCPRAISPTLTERLSLRNPPYHRPSRTCTPRVSRTSSHHLSPIDLTPRIPPSPASGFHLHARLASEARIPSTSLFLSAELRNATLRYTRRRIRFASLRYAPFRHDGWIHLQDDGQGVWQQGDAAVDVGVGCCGED